MIKVISTNNDNKSIEFDFYFPIPTGNNSAGITWAEAVELTGRYETEIIETVEYIKVRRSFTFSSVSLTNAQRLAELTAHHTSLLSTAQTILQNKLKFTGYEIT